MNIYIAFNLCFCIPGSVVHLNGFFNGFRHQVESDNLYAEKFTLLLVFVFICFLITGSVFRLGCFYGFRPEVASQRFYVKNS